MSAEDRRREAEALDWVIRLEDPHFADWAAHVAWLEADRRHAEAFDAAWLALEAATQGLEPAPPVGRSAAVEAAPPLTSPSPVAGPSRDRPPRRWALGVGGALAAGLVALVALPPALRDAPRVSTVSTAPGEQRHVALADGSQVTLNGGSVLRLDAADPRRVELAQGEGFFAIVHDADHPFTVRAGDAQVRDIGTAFDLVQESGRTRLAVHEGAVRYEAAGLTTRLDRGQALEIADGTAVRRQVDGAAVGGWRAGRLVYADSGMAEVAGDLARALGRPVRLGPAAATMRFTGVLILDRDGERTLRRVAAATGLALHRDGSGWRLDMPAR
ncbi:FecR family protein [Sphingomonas morindae]|uniref:FecR domain-containing protein n=1 Tax=Sphingomonas morindae TaxID=1541170 RepID=A0ABY4X978_9SPHN|nr:FecR domain-containing protein [Sphingomonas morindae]USI73414.1 FecR domain-containing protein [Sphingomonas morindae]